MFDLIRLIKQEEDHLDSDQEEERPPRAEVATRREVDSPENPPEKSWLDPREKAETKLSESAGLLMTRSRPS
jgi:hypothetical protein